MIRILKITLIIIGSLLLLIVIGVKVIVEPMMQKRVQAYLDGTQSEFYTYTFKALKVNFFGGTLSIEEAAAIPGEAAFDSLLVGVYDDIDQFYAKEISLTMNYYSYFENREVEISEIRIIDPEITVFYSPNKRAKKKDPVAINGIFSDSFQGVHLNYLHLENAAFSFKNIEKEEPDITLKSLNVDIKDISITPETMETLPIGIDFSTIEVTSGTVNIALNEYYDLEIESINIHIEKEQGDRVKPGTDLIISGIHYAPNKFALEQLRTNKIRNLLEISTSKVSFEHFTIQELIEEKKLAIDKLIISEPSIRLYVNSKIKKSSKKNPSKFVVSKVIEKINIKEFNIENGQVVISDIHKSASDLNLREVGISFKNILVNEQTHDLPFGISYEKGMFTSQKGSSDLGEFYRMETGLISFDFLNSNILLSDIRLIPKQTRLEFSKVTPYEQDQFEMSFPIIKINKIDQVLLNDDLALKIQSIEVINPTVSVFRDKWVDDQEFAYKPLPSDNIRNLEFPIWIDSLRIRNGTMTYEQLGDVVKYENEQPGKASFTQLDADAFRITNNPEYLRKNPELVINAKAIFMESRMLTAQYRFNITDTTDLFHVTAKMDSFPTKALNPMVRNILLVEMPDGIIHSITLNMTGNDDVITGKIQMEYENLNVNILKAKKPNKSSGFLNTIANGVIIKRNTRDRGKFTTGIVNAKRQKNKSVFNFTWNGIKSGLVSTVVPFTKKEKTKNKRADR